MVMDWISAWCVKWSHKYICWFCTNTLSPKSTSPIYEFAHRFVGMYILLIVFSPTLILKGFFVIANCFSCLNASNKITCFFRGRLLLLTRHLMMIVWTVRLGTLETSNYCWIFCYMLLAINLFLHVRSLVSFWRVIRHWWRMDRTKT